VQRSGFSFQVPSGWDVAGGANGANAGTGTQQVRVATFPLVKTYVPALFEKVRTELDTRMAAVAKETSGAVAGHRVVTVDGAKAHSFDVKVGDRVDTYTFVLRGKREFELICSADAGACSRLLTSFDAQG